MAKCYICDNEAITTCRKCARPICTIHHTTVHGSSWCHECLQKEESADVGSAMILFGIGFIIGFAIFLLPFAIYTLDQGGMIAVGLIFLALVMTILGILLLSLGIKKKVSKK